VSVEKEDAVTVAHSLLVAEGEADDEKVCVGVPVKETDPEDEKEFFSAVSVPPLSTDLVARPDAVAHPDAVAVPEAAAPGEEEGEAEAPNADCRFGVTTAMNPRYSSTASVVHCTVRKRPVLVHEPAAGTEKPEIPAPLVNAGLLTLGPSYRKSWS